MEWYDECFGRTLCYNLQHRNAVQVSDFDNIEGKYCRIEDSSTTVVDDFGASGVQG